MAAQYMYLMQQYVRSAQYIPPHVPSSVFLS
jgi:hypothetical protein